MELLPCPFCGKENPEVNDIEFSTQIMCSSEDGCNASVSALTEKEAAEKWNKRAS